MKLKTIKENIKEWNKIRDKKKALEYLTSGYAIEVFSEDFYKWDKRLSGKKGVYINMYLGLDDKNMAFYMVDSETDKKMDYKIGENLFVQSFRVSQEENPDSIRDDFNFLKESKATARIFKWFFYSNIWFSNCKSKKEVVQVFQIPYLDFVHCFKDEESKVLLFFAIKDNIDTKGKKYKDCIEVIVCSQKNGFPVNKNIVDIDFQDVTTPHPPFSIIDENFNLL